MKKKMLSVLLGAAIVASMVGCGSSEKTDNGAASAETAEEASVLP